MQKRGIKDCQNTRQLSILCYNNLSEFLEGRRQRERKYELGNLLFYLLQILLQTFAQNRVVTWKYLFSKVSKLWTQKKDDIAQM